MSQGYPTLMTRSMVTRAWGNAGKNRREELVSPDGELSQIDDFILPAFPFISPLFSLLAGSAHPLSNSLSESDEAKYGTSATVLCGGVC